MVPEHTSGFGKTAPKNTVRNQYRRQLMAVSHLAPESLRDTWPAKWEELAVDETRWRGFMKKVNRWQEEEETKTQVCKSARGKHPDPRTEDDQKSCRRRVRTGIQGRQGQMSLCLL